MRKVRINEEVTLVIRECSEVYELKGSKETLNLSYGDITYIKSILDNVKSQAK